MAVLVMRHDFRAPAISPASRAEIYTAAREQFVWADQQGFDSLVLSEHHGVDDGWLPAPLTMAGIVLSATQHARVMIERVDLAVARSDPDCRTDRGARQRVPGPVVGGLRRGVSRRGVRHGGARARGARSHARRGCRDRARSLTGRGVRVARARRRGHAEASHRSASHAVRRRGSARGGTRARRACGSRCSR